MQLYNWNTNEVLPFPSKLSQGQISLSVFLPGTTEYAIKKSASDGILCTWICSARPLASAVSTATPESNCDPWHAWKSVNITVMKTCDVLFCAKSIYTCILSFAILEILQYWLYNMKIYRTWHNPHSQGGFFVSSSTLHLRQCLALQAVSPSVDTHDQSIPLLYMYFHWLGFLVRLFACVSYCCLIGLLRIL